MKQAVMYTRVSTGEQGKSGLGLEAQKAAVANFCASSGFHFVAEFQDIASGKLPAMYRPGLSAALEKAKRLKCPIIVAKLDRLSRSVSFVSALMERGVPFFCADLGIDVDPFMLHIHAAVGEKERKMIGARTSAALQAKKARKEVVGNLASLPTARRIAAQVKKAEAQQFASRVYPMIEGLKRSGMSFNSIARQFNQTNLPTSSGGCWTATAVIRVVAASKVMILG